jgi:hypothetical protein
VEIGKFGLLPGGSRTLVQQLLLQKTVAEFGLVKKENGAGFDARPIHRSKATYLFLNYSP